MTSTTKPRASKSSAAEKIEHPAKQFSDPAEVVTDRSLSDPEKKVALDALEQDARQLAVAAAEGMAGGEPTNLRNVMEAERKLEPSSTDAAFAAVLRSFEEQRRNMHGTDTDVLITRAIDAIHAARDAIRRQQKTPVPPGAPQPGSEEELQEEITKEKLDPGA
jgi:hypothetical protein